MDVRMMQPMAPVRGATRWRRAGSPASGCSGRWATGLRPADGTPRHLDADAAERHGEDVAETIFSLITSNPFVTGETIVIDGGYAATT